MLEYDIDIMTLTELNTAWDCLHYNEWLPAKTRGWWEANQWSISHNKQDAHGDGFQLGGTAVLVLNKLLHKTMKPGDDPAGIGQWSWVRLRGKENHFLRVVSVYCPCKSDGHLTTYQQQVWWLSKQGKNVCPHDQILKNLKAQIETWQTKEDMVIILVDINENI